MIKPGEPPVASDATNAQLKNSEVEEDYAVVDLGDTVVYSLIHDARHNRRFTGLQESKSRSKRYALKLMSAIQPNDRIVSAPLRKSEASTMVDVLNNVIREVMET
jgi:hypothetical protein